MSRVCDKNRHKTWTRKITNSCEYLILTRVAIMTTSTQSAAPISQSSLQSQWSWLVHHNGCMGACNAWLSCNWRWVVVLGRWVAVLGWRARCLQRCIGRGFRIVWTSLRCSVGWGSVHRHLLGGDTSLLNVNKIITMKSKPC